jgi:hypothetical protein
MDFNDFSNEIDSSKRTDFDPSAAQLGFENWGWSALNVGIWNTIITVGLAVPVAAYLESFNHEPELQSDGTFIWSYSFDVAGVQHSAELHGRVEGNDVHWDMFISREGDYDNFNWYSGVSTLTHTEGSWTLNKDPQNPVPFIDIEWHSDPEAGAADITYTNVEPNAAGNGGYIAYAVNEAQTYESSYTVFNAGADNLTEIEWSPHTKAGRVRDAAHFGDSEWNCWDENRQNVDCTQ